MTEKLWYIARQGQQHGPISDQEIALFVKEGYLQPDDFIWRQGMPEWATADQLESLMQEISEAEAEEPASDEGAAQDEEVAPAEEASPVEETAQVEQAAPAEEASSVAGTVPTGEAAPAEETEPAGDVVSAEETSPAEEVSLAEGPAPVEEAAEAEEPAKADEPEAAPDQPAEPVSDADAGALSVAVDDASMLAVDEEEDADASFEDASPYESELAAAAPEAAGPAEPKRSSGRLVVGFLVVLLLLAGAAATYWFGMLPRGGDKAQDRIAGESGEKTVPDAGDKPVAASPPSTMKMATLRKDGTELVVEGGLLAGIAEAVKAELDKAPEVKLLRLESSGGETDAARALAALVAVRELVTYSTGGCSGACMLPFQAGKSRFLGENARVGFHKLRYSDEQQLVADKAAMKERGVPAKTIEKAASASADSPWTPTLDELVAASLIDGVTAAPDFGTAFDDDKSLAAFLAGLGRTEFARVLQQHVPASYQVVVDAQQVALAANTGYSPRTYSALFVNSLKRDGLKKARSAPDQEVSDVAALLTSRIKKLAGEDPAKCYKYYFAQELGDIDYGKNFTQAEIMEELDLWIRLLAAAAGNPQEAPAQPDIQATMQSVLDTLSKEQGADVGVIAKRPAPGSDKMGTYCKVLANLYEIILRQPLADRGKLLRFIFAGTGG